MAKEKEGDKVGDREGEEWVYPNVYVAHKRLEGRCW